MERIAPSNGDKQTAFEASLLASDPDVEFIVDQEAPRLRAGEFLEPGDSMLSQIVRQKLNATYGNPDMVTKAIRIRTDDEYGRKEY